MSAESADVVVIGAGVVGAACAYFLARERLSVVVVDRECTASGTTGAGEGNILVSDKEPGPELQLALLSNRLWRELGPELGPEVELEEKGGLVVAPSSEALDGLVALAGDQRAAGVEVEAVQAAELHSFEPNLASGLAGGAYYPQDLQIQPMLAAVHLLRLARAHGARVLVGCEVTGVTRGSESKVTGLITSRGNIAAGTVVNAAGTWGGAVAAMAGAKIPIMPRRGFLLVTEPLPRVIRHKVYDTGYVANVGSSAESLQTSTVIEGTASGPILIGASRERVGFDGAISWPVLGRIARQAVTLFPFLAGVRTLRAYRGFRPYCPDHLPVIGRDPRVPGLVHACGHEGAGIGLAPATGRLVAQAVTGAVPDVSLTDFAPERFELPVA
jgi:glycine/D-amino acid oxidase-like deaminating enzyme